MKQAINKVLNFLGIQELGKIRHQIKVNKAIKGRNVEERFSRIYQDGVWFANKESASGTGSTLEVTDKVRIWLPEMLKTLGAETLVDVGCGDYNWMQKVDLPCIYIGTDIVKSVIENNQKKYNSDQVSFIHSNAIEEPIPHGDVILCRDVLFHLSFEDGLKLLDNVFKAEAKYFISTSHVGLLKNEDIYSGNFRKIALELAPYNLPKPDYILFETELLPDRFLGVWKIK